MNFCASGVRGWSPFERRPGLLVEQVGLTTLTECCQVGLPGVGNFTWIVPIRQRSHRVYVRHQVRRLGKNKVRVEMVQSAQQLDSKLRRIQGRAVCDVERDSGDRLAVRGI